jgi:large subunit ribosomal protein L28
MSKVCSVCNKGKMGGNLVSHSNRKTPKIMSANLHKVKIVTENGSQKREYICSKCLKSGKVNRA